MLLIELLPTNYLTHNGVGCRRVKVPKPRAYKRESDAKVHRNFIFYMEKYFWIVGIDLDRCKG